MKRTVIALACASMLSILAGSALADTTPAVPGGNQAAREQLKSDRETLKADREKMKAEHEQMKADRAKLREDRKAARAARKDAAAGNVTTPATTAPASK